MRHGWPVDSVAGAGGLRASVLVAAVFAISTLAACIVSPQPTPEPLPTSAPTLAAATPAPTTASATPAPTPAIAWDDWSVYQAALRPAERDELATLVDPPQYRIAVTLDAAAQALRGEQWIHYTNPSTQTLTLLPLRLYPNLRSDPPNVLVHNLAVNGKTATVSMAAANTALLVPLDPPLAPQASADVYLTFSAQIPAGAGGNYGTYSVRQGIYALAEFYPTVPAYDSSGWQLEIPSPLGDVTTADAGLYDVTLTAPSDLIVVATGATLDKTPATGGLTTWHLAGGPLREFNIVASADYEVASDQVGDVTVNSYYTPDIEAGGRDALQWASDALRIFEDRFGPYPYTELDVAATPNDAGGVEYPGMVVIASRVYTQSGAFAEFATAHEVAHQWWYNEVGNDQVEEPWLDEALAQYSTLLYYSDLYGAAGRAGVIQSFNERWDRVRAENDQPAGLPVDDYSDRAYGAIVYGKGPLFLDALRSQMGDQTFFQFLKDYLNTYRWRIATTADFQTLAEKTCACRLEGLFEEWLGR